MRGHRPLLNAAYIHPVYLKAQFLFACWRRIGIQAGRRRPGSAGRSRSKPSLQSPRGPSQFPDGPANRKLSVASSTIQQSQPPRRAPAKTSSPRTPNAKNLQMWKICQEARPKTEVMTPHSTPLPPLYPQRYLAGFRAGLGILIIGGKERIFPRQTHRKRPLTRAAFSISGRKIHATFLYRAQRRPTLHLSRSPRPALLLRSPPQPGRNPPVRVLQPQGPALSLHHPARPELLLHAQPAQSPRCMPRHPHPPPHQAPKGPGKVAHFHQLATHQNSPPGTPVRSATCRSPVGGGGVGGRRRQKEWLPPLQATRLQATG